MKMPEYTYAITNEVAVSGISVTRDDEEVNEDCEEGEKKSYCMHLFNHERSRTEEDNKEENSNDDDRILTLSFDKMLKAPTHDEEDSIDFDLTV
jgi:hypothetical protein